ncbi:DEAD/DEAH box helicase [Cohnella nanjingensis]|uniref:DEAD/DEAH box helicase n=1 Tax=Cohnella nanjingensis TaxID=1387779 RepID=A0A7X0RS40_9BACL|nr:DEAD/DEAH box helicase [Cohnella nanjingensis]MBB6672672.1 DEAD/DEAH box helicase [Cohnella nanjingensis]
MSEARKVPFHPLIREWFDRSFGEPTDVQKEAWQAIGSGAHTLIAAPTGSGKTLAALLPCLNRLASASGAPRAPGVRIVYITPLKALNNDISHHAVRFVDELKALAAELGTDPPDIRCEVRTGDTPPAKRAAMLRRPPEMLVTTPESLYLLLTSDKGRDMLATTETVIVDEIHDLAADKRGAHLSLSLERLTHRAPSPPQRIGVSATQKPLERVARFLGGWMEARDGDPAEGADMRPRPVTIVESAIRKRMRVAVTMPDPNMPAADREAVWKPLLDRIMAAVTDCRSVLLFANSRRLCERLCLRLNDHVGYEMARAHHGSVSRERRLEVERMLKDGSLRCIVATSSLELGIDIGHIDLVIQIDSPQEAARGIQRIGRAGHAVGEDSRGVVIARQKALLPEIAVLSRQISLREIEEIRIPEGPMDVLSQQAVAMAAMDDWPLGELYRLIRRSDSYQRYPLERLKRMLQVLAGFYPFAKPLLDWDRETDTLRGRSNSRMAAVTGAGTIPQSGGYPVHHLDSRANLGEVDEEFIQESRVGDVFLLGTSSWMIRDIRNDRVYVSEAGNRFSEVPFWRNEAGGRSYELGMRVGAFLREAADRLRLEEREEEGDPEASARAERESDDALCAWLDEMYGMDPRSAGELTSFIRAQHRAVGLPTDRQIVIEHYRDVMNQTHVVVHHAGGRAVNLAWQLAIERQFEQLLPYRLYGNAKDNGIEFVLPEWDASWLQVLYQVTPANLERLLTEAVTGSPLLAIAFRKIAETSLLLSRSFTRTPMWQKRLRSEALLRSALPYAEQFPYLREAMSECLHDYLGYAPLKRLLEEIAAGQVALVVRETPYPSPFASQFVADYANMRLYEGDGLDETTRLQLMNVSKELTAQLFGAEAMSEAISEEVVAEESRRLEEPARRPANPDELAALLKQRGDLTARELGKLAGDEALGWLEALCVQGRALPLDAAGDGEFRWIAADEREVYEAFPETPASVSFVLGRYVEHQLSFTETELCDRYPSLSFDEAQRTVERWLEDGTIVRAPHAASEDERLWTSAKIASRIVRLSIRQARSKAEPVDPARWCGQIALLQHVLPGTQVQGSEGLREAIARLQGLFLPLSHWETIIFPSRVANYRKEDLDLLCASGEVLWIGRKDEGDKEGKLAFFLAEAKALLAPFAHPRAEEPTKHPKLLRLLEEGGASFLTRLSREMDAAPSELLPDLLELVWEGRVSNDQFAPLRLHAQAGNAKRAQRAKAGSGLGRWYATAGLAEDGPALPDDREGREAGAESPALVWAHHLLQVYGMVNRELVARTSPFAWDDLYPILKRLEEWGAVTRGTFIRGMSTLQFTTREISDAVRRPLPAAPNALTVLSSADPANPFGMMVDWPAGMPGASFARKPGNFLLLDGDRWAYWVENNGKRIFRMPEADRELGSPERQAALLQAAFQAILRRQKLSKLSIELWDGEAVTETDAAEMLLRLGAERDRRSLVFWLN